MHSTQLQAADSQASLKLCNNPLLARRLDNDGARLAVSHPPLLLLVLCLCHCAPQLGSLQQRPFSCREIKDNIDHAKRSSDKAVPRLVKGFHGRLYISMASVPPILEPPPRIDEIGRHNDAEPTEIQLNTLTHIQADTGLL